MTNDFKHFGDKMTKIKHRQIDKSYEVYLALYQGVSGTEEEYNVYKEFSPNFFDLVIVLDTIINSMTEFKQIIGRGTRLRPDKGKTHFTIMDFRNATKLFSDPEFDGKPEPDERFDPGGIIDPKPDPIVIDGGHETMKYVIDDVQVTIVAERVQYYDTNGQLVTKSFAEFSRENVQKGISLVR